MNQEQSQVATVYTVKEISTMLKLSIRKAYDLCNTTADFKVIRIGRCLRVVKQSFDDWFNGCANSKIC